MGILRGLGLIAVSVLISSCWTPWFDEDSSLAGLTSGKLQQDSQITIYLDSHGESRPQYIALPEQVRKPQVVTFLLRDWTQLSVQTYMASSGVWSQYGYYVSEFSYPVSDQQFIRGVPGLTKSPLAADVVLFAPTLAGGSLERLTGGSKYTYPATPVSSPLVLAVGTAPDVTNYTQTLLPTLELKAGSDLALVCWVSTSGGGDWAQASPIWTVAGYSGNRDFGALAVNPNDLTLAYPKIYWTHSKADSQGRFLTERYDPSTATVVSSWRRTDVVEAVLTTGELLTRDGAYWLVCRADGTPQYTIPAGNLQFVGEFQDTEYRIRFSQVASGGGNNGESTVTFYSLPTTKLSTLR